MNELTEKESKVANLFLKYILLLDRSYIIKSNMLFYFNKQKIKESSANIICEKIELHGVFSLIRNKDDSLRTINFDKEKIKCFLKDGGLHSEWLKNDKLKNDAKISRLQAKTFFIVLSLGLIGGLYSLYDFFIQAKNIDKRFQKLDLNTLKNRESRDKLHTLILNQKNLDSLRNSKKLSD